MVLDLSFNNIGSDPTFISTKQKLENIEKLKEYVKIRAEEEEKRKNPKQNKGGKKAEKRKET